jgi:transposase
LVGHAARHGRLEQMTKKIAVAETAVAVQRIDAIFDIERDISDKRAEERLRARRVTSADVVAELETWLRAERTEPSRHAEVAD